MVLVAANVKPLKRERGIAVLPDVEFAGR